jgi:phosphoribosylformimino-5-aminoimidazole carboxamide ribotide isomerase
VEIIPVIDLLQGKVVRAQRGERSRYLPIRTPLCDSSKPADIANALLGLYPFKTLYIADLDAIQGLGDNADTVRLLKQQHPEVTFWIDSGIRMMGEWHYSRTENIRCVVGSEAQKSADQYMALTANLAFANPILSLDFNSQGFIGPSSLLQPEYWPESLICMTLGKVGSYGGPDTQLLTELMRKSPQGKIYAAGGIRDLQDMQQLKSMGVCGALVASSLHDGRLRPSDIAQLAT